MNVKAVMPTGIKICGMRRKEDIEAANRCRPDYIGFILSEGFRRSVFMTVSSLSTTGMVNMDYAECPQFVIGMLILMMVIGGEIGSTAGGIKISRVYVMLRLCWVQIKKKLNPSRFVEAPYYVKASGKMPIDRELADDTTRYAVAYLVIENAHVLTS